MSRVEMVTCDSVVVEGGRVIGTCATAATVADATRLGWRFARYGDYCPKHQQQGKAGTR